VRFLLEADSGYDRESAVQFCKKYGMDYRILPPQESQVNKTVAKQYADNFMWDGDEESGVTGTDFWATKRSGTKVRLLV
jgi:hypothetical protein